MRSLSRRRTVVLCTASSLASEGTELLCHPAALDYAANSTAFEGDGSRWHHFLRDRGVLLLYLVFLNGKALLQVAGGVLWHQ